MSLHESNSGSQSISYIHIYILVVPNDFTYLLYVFSFKNLSQNVFGTCNWGIPNINTEHCPTLTTNFPFATTCKSFQDTSPYYGSTISPNNTEPQLTGKACIQLPTRHPLTLLWYYIFILPFKAIVLNVYIFIVIH